MPMYTRPTGFSLAAAGRARDSRDGNRDVGGSAIEGSLRHGEGHFFAYGAHASKEFRRDAEERRLALVSVRDESDLEIPTRTGNLGDPVRDEAPGQRLRDGDLLSRLEQERADHGLEALLALGEQEISQNRAELSCQLLVERIRRLGTSPVRGKPNLHLAGRREDGGQRILIALINGADLLLESGFGKAGDPELSRSIEHFPRQHREPRPDLLVEHRLELPRRTGKKREDFSGISRRDFDPEPGGGSPPVRKDGRSLGNHRLPAIDLGHLDSPLRESLQEPLENSFIETHLDTESAATPHPACDRPPSGRGRPRPARDPNDPAPVGSRPR